MKIMNLRSDSLAQIVSYSNIYAGSQPLVFDTIGIVVGSLIERMGGYGRLLSIYTGQDPPHKELLSRFNFSKSELDVLKNVSSYEIFGEGADRRAEKKRKLAIATATATATAASGDSDAADGIEVAADAVEEYRDVMEEEKQQLISQGWPTPLQEHTAEHLSNKSQKEKEDFLLKRSSRFVRKMCRPSLEDTITWLEAKSDSLIIVTNFDPLSTLMKLFPYLAPSCPVTLFCEHLEPLAKCFNYLKNDHKAIKLQLSETWMREYQMIENCTHPNMVMSATCGYILTGVKTSVQQVEVEKKGKHIGQGVAVLKHGNRATFSKKQKGEGGVGAGGGEGKVEGGRKRTMSDE
jgi:tRNA (adenine-N(1)-)-methyltransferase non-catalytic subunit